MGNEIKESVFKDFTRKYSLSKTLRFELKPVGETLENMREHLRYDKQLQTFLADQEIEDAYQTLKPVFDYLHEQFITESLESDIAKNMSFSEYLGMYKNRKALKDKDFDSIEKKLRKGFAEVYEEAAEKFREKVGKDKKEDYILQDKSYKVFTEQGILKYIEKNIESFSEIKPKENIKKALEAFEGFFTYFGGFNQNRENYYETEKEAATAVATRIINENLPKFCDNLISFEKRQQEYKGVYQFLKDAGNSLVDKEDKALIPITDNIFKIENFSTYFSQKKIEVYNQQIGNANFLINLYNQAKKEEKSFSKLSFLKILYKQIGCGKRDALFFTITHDKRADVEKDKNKNIEACSVQEILELANKAGTKYFDGFNDDGIINTVPEFLDYLRDKEYYSGVYWSKIAINTISSKYFANWHDLKDKLKTAKIFKKNNKDDEDEVSIPATVELEGIFNVLNSIENWKEVLFKESVCSDAEKKSIIEKSKNSSQALLELIFLDIQKNMTAFLDKSLEVIKLEEYQKEKSKEVIKNWFDHALAVTQVIKYFLVKENKIKGEPLDAEVSQGLDVILRSEDANWFKWYDALRNYLTKKPQDGAKENKLKLNFQNSSLLKGWDMDLESQRKSVILRSGNAYYLVILGEKYGSVFNDESILTPKNNEETFEKMYFKQQTNVFRQLPRVGFPYKNDKTKPMVFKGLRNFDETKFTERVEKYGLNEDILKIKDEFDMFQKLKNKGDVFSKQKLKQLISYYKNIIEVDYEDVFSVSHVLEKDYLELNDLYEDFEKTAYELNFKDISKNYVDNLVEEGKIYMFKIYNKDFSLKVSGKKNLHTIYFENLFNDPEKNIQLSANAQIFYRKLIINEKHKKHGYEHKDHIIELKRFTEEKFLFHCPIAINAKSIDGVSKGKPNPKVIKIINDLIKNDLTNNSDVNFLGVDRGEKHLAFYSLIDKNGVIKEQGTLNIPFLDKDGMPRTVKAEKRVLDKDGKEKVEMVECKDYNELLEARAGDRNYGRKNWQTIGTIKELKEGYISQVVRKIADLAIENNAFIVLENLDTGFKRGRQKIDKSVYQKLELALAKKLNFLVNKEAKNGELGSVAHSLQLTPPVTNYGDIESRPQVGIMLYVKADYTSQTDPITGWRKSIYLKKGSEENIKTQITNKFSDIGFDGKDYFFTYKDECVGKKWTLYPSKNGRGLDRFHKVKVGKEGQWKPEKMDVVDILNGIFENFDKNRSLHSQIVEEKIELNKISKDHTAWESLRFTIDLVQQIRNTGISKEDDDFILSPVRSEKGDHFDSRKAKSNEPNSGDANGAYNIARKGIVMNEHIKLERNLFIKDSEWDAWLAGKEYWQKWLKDNPPIKK